MAAPSRSRWSLEALDVLERRGAMLWAVVAVVIVAGALAAFFLPEVVPPTPVVGAAVAVAGLLLAMAVVTAVDAGDALVRGPRHVRAAGGELVGVLPERVGPEGADELAAAVLDARPDRRLTLGLAGAQAATPTSAWAGALATALARRGASVLLVDLASGASPQDGILEVLEGDRPLARTVELDPELKLARIDAGRDLDAALRAAVLLPERLPRDLEVLLVALPAIAKGEVLEAAGALDTVLVLTASGKTRRARLQAAVAAIETGGTAAQVVLVDGRLASAAPARPRSEAEEPAPHTQPTPSTEGDAAEGDAGDVPEGSDVPDGAGGAGAGRQTAAAQDARSAAGGDEEAAESVAAAEERPTTRLPGRTDPTAPAPSAAASAEGPGSSEPRAAAPTEALTAPVVTDATHLEAASVDLEAAGEDQPEVGAASPVDLSASPRSTVRLVRGVEPSPRRPLRPPPETHDPAGPAGSTSPLAPTPAVEAAPPDLDDLEDLDDQDGDASDRAAPGHSSEDAPAPEDEPAAEGGPAHEDEPAPEDGRVEAVSTRDELDSSSAGEPSTTPVLGVRDPGDVRAARGAAALDAIAASPDHDAGEGSTSSPPVAAGPEATTPGAQPDADADAVREDPAPSRDEHEEPSASRDEPFEGVDTGPVVGAGDEDLPRTLRGDDEDDPLRTTAQLAIVLDQIEDRDDRTT